MDLLFCLRDILSDFRHLFNQQNFTVFQAFIFGFIANKGTGTLTDLYQSSGRKRGIGHFRSSFPGGNGALMLSLHFSSDASNISLRIGLCL